MWSLLALHCALSRRLASDGPIPPREPVCLPVCLSVCLSVCQHVSQNRRSRLHLLFRACYLWCDSVFLCRHCDMLCISGFVYDVTFSHKGDLSIPLQRRHCGVISGLLLLLLLKNIFSPPAQSHRQENSARHTKLWLQRQFTLLPWCSGQKPHFLFAEPWTGVGKGMLFPGCLL